jgi:hypothetical protein
MPRKIKKSKSFKRKGISYRRRNRNRKTITKNLVNCCSLDSKTEKKLKGCIRMSDRKTFNLPRRFTKKQCNSTKKKGFTMRSSCAIFKDC